MSNTGLRNHNPYASTDFTRYVGYTSENPLRAAVFNKPVFDLIKRKVSTLLRGVHPDGKVIAITDDVVRSRLDQVVELYTPEGGDIYTRYNFEGLAEKNYPMEVIDITVNSIVKQIKDEFETVAANNKLTIWTTLYGDFNEHGLRQYPPIKVSKRRSDRMQFNMNY